MGHWIWPCVCVYFFYFNEHLSRYELHLKVVILLPSTWTLFKLLCFIRLLLVENAYSCIQWNLFTFMLRPHHMCRTGPTAALFKRTCDLSQDWTRIRRAEEWKNKTIPVMISFWPSTAYDILVEAYASHRYNYKFRSENADKPEACWFGFEIYLTFEVSVCACVFCMNSSNRVCKHNVFAL